MSYMRRHPHLGQIDYQGFSEWLDSVSPAPEIKVSIVVASEERTGSEWLCQLMGASRRLGRPMEYLNAHWNMRFFADYPQDVSTQIQIAHRIGVTSNGVFAMKLHAQHFDRLQREARLSDVFTKPAFVWLSRQDRLAQAISRSRAQQSGRYHSSWREERPAVYDADAIERTIEELTTLSARWDRYFARNGLFPLRINYEQLSAHPLAVLRAIGNLVGETIDENDLIVEHELEVQSDDINDEWRCRFISEKGDVDRFD